MNLSNHEEHAREQKNINKTSLRTNLHHVIKLFSKSLLYYNIKDENTNNRRETEVHDCNPEKYGKI